MDNNGMESMLDIYLFEANGLLEQLDEILLDCEKEGTFESDSVNEIFRIMHTIKGSSAMMQFNSLMTVAHKIEDLFYYIRENGLTNGDHGDLFDLMFKCSDFLKSEIESVESNMPLIEDVSDLTDEIKTLLDKFSNGGEEKTSEPVAKEKTKPKAKAKSKAKPKAKEEKAEETSEPVEEVKQEGLNLEKQTADNVKYGLKMFFDPEAQMENIRAFMLVRSISDIGIETKYFPEDIQTNPETIETIIHEGFIMSFATAEDLKKAIPTVEQFIYVKDYSVIGFDNEQPEEKQEATQEKTNESTKQEKTPVNNTNNVPNANTGAPAKQSLINVNLTKLDKLMDLVGEIVISESMITALPTLGTVDMDNFSKATRELAKLTDELQEIVMSIRMVPVAGVFQKMHRIVRDMSKKLGKDVELQLIGEETEVDKTIVDNIGDPLMHVVRNAMDHGLESTADRIAAGKPEKGTVTLSAQNTGGEILITVSDDGKGMDPAKILKKAKENGLATKPDNEYTEKEILAFVLMPGFSTKEVASEFSGRGVGMDVAVKNVQKVGGDVSVESKLGKGTTVTFKIPLTLSIVKGMQVSVANSMFTIPINNIRQSFKADDTNVMYDSNMREIVMIRNEYFPVIKLHEIYGIETEITNIKDGILLLVEVDEKSYCIFADQLIGEHQVVVKPIPMYLNKYNVKDVGIGGCAILGDGSITLILDMNELGNTL